MGRKWKRVPALEPAIQRLYEDVETNNFRTFAVGEIPGGIIAPGLEQKVTHYGIVCSGSMAEERQWMAVLPFRVDYAPQESPYPYQYDKDPIVFYLDLEGVPHSTGIITLHTKYPGRNELIEESHYTSVQEAVTNLRRRYIGSSGELEDAPQDFIEATNFGAQYFRRLEELAK
ncbi:hypothetical protein ACFL4Y_00185 [Gemmatimonadota bacterium]